MREPAGVAPVAPAEAATPDAPGWHRPTAEPPPVEPAAAELPPAESSAVETATVGTASAAPPGPARPAEPATAGRSWWRSTGEWVVVVGLALAAAFLVKTFVLQTFYIPSASMESTLMIKDRVFVNKLAYDFHPIHRGDIVVFTLPPGESAGPGIDDLIKRVIGLPGDTIEAIGGRVYINGRPLAEPYLAKGMVTTLLPRQTVPAGKYFLMGDNRTDSKDSRFFGPVSGSRVVGRAFVRVWPLSRLGLL